MSKILHIVFIILNSFFAFSTPQSADYVIIGKDTLPLFRNLFKEKEYLLKRDTNYQNKNQIFSDCWKGYKAIWKIENNRIYLTEIAGCQNELIIEDDIYLKELLGDRYTFHDMEKVSADLSLLFPSKYKNGRVHADWISNSISIPKGKAIYNVHLGHHAIFEFEHEIEIKKGIITDEKTYDNRKTSINYSNHDLREFVIKKLNKRILNKIKDEDLVIHVTPIIYYDTTQKVISVKFQNSESQPFQKQIKRILLSIKDWNIRYRKGKTMLEPSFMYFLLNRKNIITSQNNSKK